MLEKEGLQNDTLMIRRIENAQFDVISKKRQNVDTNDNPTIEI